MNILKIIIGILFVWIVYGFWQLKNAPPIYTPPPVQAIKTPPTAKEIASEERFQKVVAYGTALKSSMREPKSVEWLSITANDDASVACFKYKGRNGFGGMSIEHIAIVKGQAKTDSRDWNKHCTGKEMYDLKRARWAIN